MYFEIEPSGCCERKGLVQVRYCFYLEPGDHGYEQHFVDVPDFSAGQYAGEMDEMGTPVNPDDYRALIDNLPTKKTHNPFHNHFAYFTADVIDKELLDHGKSFLDGAYRKWSRGEFPSLKNLTIPVPTDNQKAKCANRVNAIKAAGLSGRLDP